MFQDEITLDEAVKSQTEKSQKLKRTQPFLLRFATGYFIVTDGTPIIVKPPSLAVAIDNLLKAFFVFNIKYPPQISVVCDFLAHMLLGMNTSMSAKGIGC